MDRREEINVSAETEEELRDRRARIRAQNQYIKERADYWRDKHDEAFKQLAKGTIVAINCRTGEYITATNRIEAGEAYEQRFGKNEMGYVFEVGGGIFIGGGGLWLR